MLRTIFLDNDMVHITNWNREFPPAAGHLAIKIDDITVNPLGNRDNYFNGFTQAYLNNTVPPSANEYTTLLELGRNQRETHNPSNGITNINADTVIEWVNYNPLNRIAAFDWDRTLSVLEGGAMPGANQPWKDLDCPPADVLVYMFGGPARVAFIRNMFDILVDRGVSIFIITNSGNAHNNRANMLAVIRSICPTFIDSHLIYSGDGSGIGGRGFTIKANALKNNAQYIALQSPVIGGRKRKMRKTKKMYRRKRRACKTSRR